MNACMQMFVSCRFTHSLLGIQDEMSASHVDYTYLGSLGGASRHWRPLGGSGCGGFGHWTLFIGCGCSGGRTFGWCGLIVGGEGGWTRFGWVWFVWTRVRLVLMELRYHSTNKRSPPPHTHTHKGKGKKEKGRQIEGKKGAITDCSGSSEMAAQPANTWHRKTHRKSN